MLKQILNLDGAQELSRNEQESINGGGLYCNSDADCYNTVCVPDGCGGYVNEIEYVTHCINRRCGVTLQRRCGGL